MAPSITKSTAPGDDSDLEDLIAKSPSKRATTVEYDPLPSMGPIGCIGGAMSLCCYTCPRLSKCVLVIATLGAVGYLSNSLLNPTREMGIMGGDYSSIKNAYELSLSRVDHWCISGDNESCKCEDPLEATPRAEFKAWTAAHKANVADVNMYRAPYGSVPTKVDVVTGKPRPPIDVAFLGESVVEAMDGRWLGKKIVRPTGDKDGQDGKRPDIGKVFERFFRKDKGGPLEGTALGIAGDYVSPTPADTSLRPFSRPLSLPPPLALPLTKLYPFAERKISLSTDRERPMASPARRNAVRFQSKGMVARSWHE
jgi:hypothetical protein